MARVRLRRLLIVLLICAAVAFTEAIPYLLIIALCVLPFAVILEVVQFIKGERKQFIAIPIAVIVVVGWAAVLAVLLNVKWTALP